jgi:outer membrane protein
MSRRPAAAPPPRARLQRLAAAALLGLVATAGARAQSLQELYEAARAFDATYLAAKAQAQSAEYRAAQADALSRPSLSATAGAPTSTISPPIGATGDSNTLSASLQGWMPLFNRANDATQAQAQRSLLLAKAEFETAEQDLIVRVAVAYFDVLAAQDTLATTRASKTAITEQLASAKRNFEVGTATITDTHEAQARFDLSTAQEIAAVNDLESKQRVLQQLTGKVYTELKHLRADVKLAPPTPRDMESWVQLAEKQNYLVQQTEAATEVARREARRASSAHMPTLDLVGRLGQSTDNGTVNTAIGRDINTASIGLRLAVPLYQGGSLSSKEREAAALSLKARDDLEGARRTAALNARQTYLAVINGIAQVGALEQAMISSQSALDSNRLGYEVGVRINIDVLNAQQQLFSTRRDLALARYNTITNQLRLKASGGGLREEDVEEINRALEP